MKLEEQVCSRELSEKLEKLGVKQESLLWWWNCSLENGASRFHLHPEVHESEGGKKLYSAFTVAELGGMLPAEITEKDRQYELGIRIRVYEEYFEWVVEYLWHDEGV